VKLAITNESQEIRFDMYDASNLPPEDLKVLEVEWNDQVLSKLKKRDDDEKQPLSAFKEFYQRKGMKLDVKETGGSRNRDGHVREHSKASNRYKEISRSSS